MKIALWIVQVLHDALHQQFDLYLEQCRKGDGTRRGGQANRGGSRRTSQDKAEPAGRAARASG